MNKGRTENRYVSIRLPHGKEDQVPIIPDHAPELPFIYVDWNTVQHLRKESSFGPLLMALTEARTRQAAMIPYSHAHIMDATAGWTGLSEEYRTERTRDLLFLEGISSGWIGSVQPIDGNDHHRVVQEAPLSACDVRGYFHSLHADNVDTPHLQAAERQVRAQMDATITEMRRIAATTPHMAPDLVESMISVLQEIFANGIPDTSSTGSIVTRLFAPLMLHAAGVLPGLNDIPPGRAVHHLEDLLRSQGYVFDLHDTIEHALATNPAQHRDDLGPMMLGMLGYQRERARDIRRGAPGLTPDQLHGRYALSSAIFLSSETRLPLRVEAWAAYTERGGAHSTWPIILHVGPQNAESIAMASETIRLYTQTFAEPGRQWQETHGGNGD